MLQTAVIITGIAFFAGIVQTVSGFGAAILMMTVMPFFFEMHTAPAIVSAVCAGLSVSVAFRFRRYIDLKRSAVPILAFLATSLSVIPVSKKLDLHVLTVVFGIFLILLALWLLVFSKKIKAGADNKTALILGGISGITSGLFGIGGPLMALYFSASTDSKEAYIANTQLLFATTNIVNTLMRAATGIYTQDLIPLTVIGIVGISLGKRIGLRLLSKIDTEKLRKLVVVLVAVAGGVITLTALK